MHRQLVSGNGVGYHPRNLARMDYIRHRLTSMTIRQKIINTVPWLVLAIGLTTTQILRQTAATDALHDLQTEFAYQTKEVTIRIQQRLAAYVQVLRGGKGLFSASREVKREAFRQYVATLELGENYPGIQGVGYSVIVPPEEKETYIRTIRQEGFPDFTIRPPGERELYSSIMFLEPFAERNLRAFGFDMYSEPVRRAAMSRARDSGQAAMSGKVKLVQEDRGRVQAGMLIYVPVYRIGASLDTEADRRTNIIGWSYATFRMDDLMAGILGGRSQEIDLEIFDGDSISPDTLLYDADGSLSITNQNHSLFQTTQVIEFAGHPWMIRLHSLPAFEERLDTHRATVMLYSGGLASGLLALLVWLLASGRERALRLAQSMTRELQESEFRWKFAIEGAGDGLWDWDIPAGAVYYSQRWKTMFGLADNEIGNGIDAWEKRLHPDDRAATMATVEACLDGDMTTYANEHRMRCKDGSWKWTLARGMVVKRSADGKPLRMIVTQSDISERKQAEEALILSGKIIDTANEAIVITDLDGVIQKVNNAYETITGFSRAEVLGKTPAISKSGRHDASFYQRMWQGLREEGRWEGEIWDRRKDGALYPKWLSINTVHNTAGVPTHYVGIFSDISEQKATERKLLNLAYYDPLTELPNRAMFRERLTHELATAHRHQQGVALFFIDLDRFKFVNDTLGHAAGDELLRIVAKRLTAKVRKNDTVARLGGDEFTVILTDVKHPEQISAIAQGMIDSLRTPLTLMEQEVNIGGSIGIALYPGDGHDFDSLTKHADMAMYLAKEKGRNNFQFFSDELQTRIFERVTLEEELTKAIARNELLLHFQPKFELAGNRVVGMESLVRWEKPGVGLVSPARFIPLAEETGLILPMGEWILENACRQSVAWNQGDTCPLQVAVNLSARQFQQPDLIAKVQETLWRTALPPECLELEITESMLMGNIEESITIMRNLRELGLSLAMDDFGTGYSSLNYLKRFPVNTLKIDQSFVRDLTRDSSDAAIVRAIIALARTLGLKVVAEGVENVEQLEFLREHGCHQVQGYYLSKPLPGDAFARFVGLTSQPPIPG
ncbi:MAG: EAL domain-containing protein [Magnetococcales bacterium]|nr:EAL domain-containing protein [Magnetococcales bacterium]